MRKILIAILFGTLLMSTAKAAPTINQIILLPSSSLWLGENLTVKVNCTDTEEIENVTMSAVGEDGFLIPSILLKRVGSIYTGVINHLYMTRPNNFTAKIICSSSNLQASADFNFSVSQFDAKIIRIIPSTIYVGDQVEIYVSATRNNQPIKSGVNFDVFLRNEKVEPKVSPPYDPNKGWIIYLDAPRSTGIYTLNINVSHSRVSKLETAPISVLEPIQFSITTDKKMIRPNDTITITLQAFDRGRAIQVTKDNLFIKLGNRNVNIETITPVSNYYVATILAPALSPGNYDLTATIYYGNYTYTASAKVSYTVPIYGKIINENGKGVTVEFRFLLNGLETLRFYTDASGSYSASIVPRYYDLEITFPQSKVYLYNTNVQNFEDPIRYYSLSADVPGLNLAGLHVFIFALKYSRASLEMKYDDTKIFDEGEIKVYKCEEWNSGRRACYGDWNEIDFSIDPKRNLVYVNDTDLGVYAIGTLKKLSVNYNLNKEKFFLRDLVRVRGMVTDDLGTPVSNASVRVSVKNTNISTRAITDNNGLFTAEFLSPEFEGRHVLTVSAEKDPYIKFETERMLDVEKSRDFSIVFPDTIRIKQGERIEQELILINIGQEDLSNISLQMSGIPDEYYSMVYQIEKVLEGEKIKLLINFSVPSDAETKTLSGTLKVSTEGVKKEKNFGFTVEAFDSTENMVTGHVIRTPEIKPYYLYILLFAISSFTLAFLLKKRSLKNQTSKETLQFLQEIKKIFEPENRERGVIDENN